MVDTYPIPPANIEPNVDTAGLQNVLTHTVHAKDRLQIVRENLDRTTLNVADSLIAKHIAHSEQLSHMITEKGGKPDASGGVGSSLSASLSKIGAMFDDDTADSMETIRDGEEEVMDAFGEALGKITDGPEHDELVKMRDEISRICKGDTVA